MRYLLIALMLLIFQSAPVQADTRVNIGINVSTYPALTPIPGYPVYYDPHANWNYFFYDGLYWVYIDDGWYSSSWYDGPWILVEPVYVPVYVLRVPVRYYRRPPVYFHGWIATAPPRWGEYWGPSWEARRRGWDHWDHHHVPRPAPLPVYQKQYSGNHYPRNIEQQHVLRSKHYSYRPQERATREHFQQQDRLRTQPQAQQSQTEPEYYRGGQGRDSRREEQAPERALERNTDRSRDSRQERRGEPDAGSAASQIPLQQNNRYESGVGARYRDREHRQPSRIERGEDTRAVSQVPNSQHNRFESGRRPGDRYGPQDTGSKNWGYGPGDKSSGNKGWNNNGGGHKQDHR